MAHAGIPLKTAPAVAALVLAAVSAAGTRTVRAPASLPAQEQGSFVDPRDGTVYRTITSGSRLWLGENLRFEMPESWVYENDPANAVLYGRLYDWETASRACPPDWHLPTATEWRELFGLLGGAAVAGGSLKEAGTRHWREPNTGATNASGFRGLPGGARRAEGTFHGLGMFGAFWSRTERSAAEAWAFYLGYHYPEASLRTSTSKGFGFSVRCLHDPVRDRDLTSPLRRAFVGQPG